MHCVLYDGVRCVLVEVVRRVYPWRVMYRLGPARCPGPKKEILNVNERKCFTLIIGFSLKLGACGVLKLFGCVNRRR